MAKPIREYYSELGVETYYRRHGADYVNPHLPQIRELLTANRRRIDYRRALDFCCGSGEVTLALRELGFPDTQASDPFTGDAYRRRFDRPCLPLSFDDVIRQGLPEQYSSIICSFALHLCPPKQLFPLAWQLFLHCPQLVIITPHKRPTLENLDGIQLDFTAHALTERGKKVFLKGYSFIQEGRI